MKVLFAAAEVYPLCKVGGLADVAGSLPKALSSLGHDVRIALPFYSLIPRERVNPKPIVEGLFTTSMDSITVYLIDNPRYFHRNAIYGEADDLERFLYFSRAVLDVPRRAGWTPDILHCHDWHTAAACLILKTLRREKPGAYPKASLFTFHNFAYQGPFTPGFAEASSLKKEMERWPAPLPLNSMMALGVAYADVLNTVSPNYAKEVLTPEYGEGLDALLRMRQERLFGVVNGIDYLEHDPMTNPYVVAPYNARQLKGKQENKLALQRRMNLPPSATTPLMGMVTRLDDQKGVDLVVQALEALLAETPVQVVILGKGRPHYEEMVSQAAQKHPTRLAASIAFDAELAALIYAGADFFLMPSRFEPCGLGQMVAMRFGTIPIARSTGGLKDTIEDCPPDLSRGTGFLFSQPQAAALVEAVKRAAAAYAQRGPSLEGWQGLVRRAMAQDFSWERSAQEYQGLYERALQLASRESP